MRGAKAPLLLLKAVLQLREETARATFLFFSRPKEK
jgi:hypothetical protein